MVFAVTLIAVFALQVGAYALYRSYRAAAERAQLRADTVATRARGGIGVAIGGSNRPGDN